MQQLNCDIGWIYTGGKGNHGSYFLALLFNVLPSEHKTGVIDNRESVGVCSCQQDFIFHITVQVGSVFGSFLGVGVKTLAFILPVSLGLSVVFMRLERAAVCLLAIRCYL